MHYINSKCLTLQRYHQLYLVNHGKHAEDFDLDDRAAGVDLLADLAHVDRVVVALAVCARI